MGTLGLGGIVRVSARFKNVFSGDVVNVYHWRNTTAVELTAAQLNTTIGAHLSAAYANVSSDLSAGTDPYDIRFDRVEYIGGKEVVVDPMGIFTWTLTTPPAGAGEEAQQTNAAIVNFRTALAGSFGRKFLGVFQEGAVQSGTLASGTATRVADWAADIIAPVVGSGATLVLGAISKKIGHAGEWVPFTAAVVNAIMGTQRRRRINHGG